MTTKHLSMALLAIAACKSSDASKDKPTAAKATAEAADPWSKKAADPKAVKDPDLKKMIELAQGGPGAAEYPQADAVVALEHDDITIKADGTIVDHYKQIVKLLDAQRGKEKFADVHIEFDSKRQTLTVDTARTVNADGEPHAASAEEIGDIVPSWLADATIYSDVRERVVSFPAVDKGSVIELEMTRTTKPSPDAALGAEETLSAWDPVLDRTVTITAPNGTVPKFSVQNLQLDPKEESSPDGHTWTFHIENQPDRHPENGSPVDAIVLPRLVWGIAPSWQKVLEPVAARFLEKAIPLPTPASVKEQADQLVAGLTTDADKATKLFAFVAHDIRSINLPLGTAGYEPHSPDVVLANRYADPRDKVALLLALANAEGLIGRPVLTRRGNVPVIASVPTLAQFDHIVAKLTVDGKDVWLDPTDEEGQYGLVFTGQDNLVLPLEKGGTELGARPPLDPSTSVSHVSATFALAANGDLDAKYAYDMTGWYANRAIGELRPLKGEPLDKFFQRSAASLSASALDKGHEVGDTMSVQGPFTVTHHVAVPGYSAAQGNFRSFELPPITLEVAADEPSASLSKRKYPLYVGVPRTEKGDVTVQLPAGWKVAYVPPKLEGSANGVSFSSGCEAKDLTVTCHDEIKLDKIVLGVDQYAAFHDAIAKLEAYERRVVLLTKA